jgi:iron complex outermembrane receptor protein
MRLLCRSLPKGAGIHLLLLLLLSPVVMLAQTGQIRGSVTDSAGHPLGGISVTVKGKKMTTITKADGTFSIPAETGNVLVFSGVSFEELQVLVGSKNVYDVEMKALAVTMSDVVVVGYGKSSRKTLSSSITTIKPDELNRGAISDVGQLLQGKVPGLNISASGDPNKAAAVVMRGASTINSPAGPFYVIDGIPGADITTVAPDDIASVDVLKDAAATAIYGNKAANGVIMITTKRGKSGKGQVSYSGYIGRETVTNGLKLMNADEIKAYVAANNSTILPTNDLGANTDWMKAIQKDAAISHNHNISMSGGNDKSTYSASINYLSKEGILQRSKLERVIGRLSIDQYALNNKVKFGLNVANSISKSNNVPLQNVVLQQAAKHLPVSPVYNSDGTYFENFGSTNYYNPVSLINNALDDTKYNSLIGAFTIEAKLPFDLTYNANVSYQRNTSLHGEYYNSYYGTNYSSATFYNNPDPGIGISHSPIQSTFGKNGGALRNTYTNTSKTVETFLTWNKKIDLHSVNVVVGYSYQDNINGEGFQSTNTNFVSDYTGYQNLGLGNYSAISGYTVNYGNDNYAQTRFISDFGRLNYSYNDKYLLQASIRRDGSSVFGKNNRWGYFPSVGAAWRISQEDFMKSVSVLSDLKLRASYGETGNAFGFGAYNSQQVYYKNGTYYNAGVYSSAFAVAQAANDDLKWEKTSTKNVGIDVAFLNGRISASIDLYEKLTTDMIYKYSVSAAIAPGGSVWGNGGKIRNRGIELSLNATPVETKDFSWNTTLNLTANKNIILDMKGPAKYNTNADSITYSDPEGPGETNTTVQILKAGHPIGQFYTRVYAGKGADGSSLFLTHADTTTTSSTPNGNTLWYAGSPQPKLLLGWSNNIHYKNFDLNLFFRGVFGNKIMNVTRADLSYVYSANSYNIVESAGGDKMTDNRNNLYSTRYIENGSYLRLDNATLGYRVKMKSAYISSLRFYTTVNNVFTITNYSGIDPEVNQGGISPGVDMNNFYPKTRTIMVGVNVGF